MEASDQILAVDGVRATEENVQKLVIGSDVVGSSVRLTARKADGGHQFDISLRRQSINFMNTFQIYTELLEQLISMSKRDKDMQNLVRRVSLKIQEIVRFQSSQLDELYGNLEVYQSSADELIRMIRSILQEQQKSEVNPEANPDKGSTHSSTDRPFTADPGASGFTNDSVLSRGATARNESLESEIRRLSTLLSKSTLMPGGGGEEDLDSLTLKQQVRDRAVARPRRGASARAPGQLAGAEIHVLEPRSFFSMPGTFDLQSNGFSSRAESNTKSPCAAAARVVAEAGAEAAGTLAGNRPFRP